MIKIYTFTRTQDNKYYGNYKSLLANFVIAKKKCTLLFHAGRLLAYTFYVNTAYFAKISIKYV